MADLDKRRHFFKQFIRLYESFPCLWNVKSHQYHDRDLRSKAYKVLVQKLQEIQPGADRTTVVKKINCFRSNLRKEKKTIQEAVRLGRIVKPKLWYHHHFDFLNKIGRIPDMDESELQGSKTVKIQNPTSLGQMKTENTQSDPLDLHIDISEDSDHCGHFPQNLVTEEPCRLPNDAKSVSAHSVISLSSTNYKPEQESYKTQQQDRRSFEFAKNVEMDLGSYRTQEQSRPAELESTAMKMLPENYRGQDQDRHAVFGKNVEMKLRYLSSTNETQRILAEKIINDALSLAEMGLLTMEHCKVLN